MFILLLWNSSPPKVVCTQRQRFASQCLSSKGQFDSQVVSLRLFDEASKVTKVDYLTCVLTAVDILAHQCIQLPSIVCHRPNFQAHLFTFDAIQNKQPTPSANFHQPKPVLRALELISMPSNRRHRELTTRPTRSWEIVGLLRAGRKWGGEGGVLARHGLP